MQKLRQRALTNNLDPTFSTYLSKFRLRIHYDGTKSRLDIWNDFDNTNMGNLLQVIQQQSRLILM